MSNKKWIIFINLTAYPCDVGGLEIFNFYLIKNLSKHYNIHQLTYCSEIKTSDIEIHKLKKNKFPKLTSPLAIFKFLLKNRNKIKLLHISFSRAYWTHWFVYVIAYKLLNIKYVMTIHGGGLAPWRPKWPYYLFFKYAETITGVSNRIIEEYTKRSKRSIIYTPPLIPFEVIKDRNKFRDKWNIASTDVVLLYAGSLKPLKAVDSLIEALGVLTVKKLRHYNLKVLIAGDGISRRDLESRVNELRLNDVVRFLGIVDRGDMNQLYNLADIYTICSEFEGLPISLLEAFANELPCITSDAPGLKELSLNNKNSLLFKTRDFQDYSKKIELLLKDIHIQDKIKKSAKLYYEKYFSYDNLINDFKEIINKVA